MTGPEFRDGHGDPARWDDDEYEAYFAWTATSQPTPAPQPAPAPTA